MWAAKTYTFSPSTTIASAEVNQNFDDMVDGLNTAMPSGMICMWSGSAASIPAGWYLCDGNNSTPNLINRFIVAATGTYAPGATGGSATHGHTYSGTSSGISNWNFQTKGSPSYQDESAGNPDHNHTISGSTSTDSVLPPYYALCYVMKS